MDRISDLPGIVIHRILSFLPTKEAARTSVLSKTWLHFWSTNTTLDFNQAYFGRTLQKSLFAKWFPKSRPKWERFVNFVDETLRRYINEKIRIQTFRLSITIVDADLASLVDDWLGIAVQNGVEELHLHVSLYNCSSYVLPPIVCSASSLKKMVLKGCKVEYYSLGDKIKCCSLDTLCLFNVCIEEPVIQYLITSCPLIRKMVIGSVDGFGRICVPNLKKFEIRAPQERVVELEAPRLESFTYNSRLGQGRPCAFNIEESQAVSRLCLTGSSITSDVFQSIVSKFPMLEFLCLNHCSKLESISISSIFLKRLSLRYCKKLVEANIDAPNLLSVHYKGTPGQYFFRGDIDTTSFVNLREFLTKTRESELFRLVVDAGNCCFNIDDLRGLDFPPGLEVEHLDLVISCCEPVRCRALLDGLFWSCHPKSLSLHWGTLSSNEFVRFLYQKLMARAENPKCCDFREIKCWRHYLNDVKIESSEGSCKRYWPLKRKTLVGAPPTLEKLQDIRFTLQWQAETF
ncbi:hypothetical protein RJ640_025423 [Escallonia rubra]|uniref:F-box domain-containing protein n=1 Tax=Escallonia rubra TaxID=112253 RepID=A0AA88ULW0_9ASTE|nr:hypothetical protein RJ640_025423 [Escallonia rubra]